MAGGFGKPSSTDLEVVLSVTLHLWRNAHVWDEVHYYWHNVFSINYIDSLLLLPFITNYQIGCEGGFNLSSSLFMRTCYYFTMYRPQSTKFWCTSPFTNTIEVYPGVRGVNEPNRDQRCPGSAREDLRFGWAGLELERIKSKLGSRVGSKT